MGRFRFDSAQRCPGRNIPQFDGAFPVFFKGAPSGRGEGLKTRMTKE